MPCTDPGADRDYTDELQRKVKKLTRFLCSVCTILDDLHRPDVSRRQVMPPEVRTWWKKHQRMDKKRLSEEAKKRAEKRERAKALSRLTERERKLLGLHGYDDPDPDDGE